MFHHLFMMDSSDSPLGETPANLLAASMAKPLTHTLFQAVMRVFLHHFFATFTPFKFPGSFFITLKFPQVLWNQNLET